MVDVQAENSPSDGSAKPAPRRRGNLDTWLNIGLGVIIVAVFAFGAYFGWRVYVDSQTNDATSGAARLIAALSDQVRKTPNDAVLRVRLGEAYGALNKYQQAIAQFNAALKIDPKHTGAYLDLGETAMLTNHNEQAKAYFLKVIDLTDASQYVNIDPDRESSYFNLGLIALQEKNYNDAAGYFKAALVIKNDASDTYYRLAQAFQGLGETDAAIQQLEIGLQFDPNFAQAHYLLGQLYQNKNDLVNASYQYKAAADIDPTAAPPKQALAALGSAGKWLSQAQSKFSSGDTEGALTAILIARNLDPKSFDAAKLHGDILIKRGDLKDALDVYKQALALQPANAALKAQIAQLQTQVNALVVHKATTNSKAKPKSKAKAKAKAKTATTNTGP